MERKYKAMVVIIIMTLICMTRLLVKYTQPRNINSVSILKQQNKESCPNVLTPEFLYETASYLLKNLQQTERLQRDPPREFGQKGLLFHHNFTNPCWYEELPTTPFTYTFTKWHYGLLKPEMIEDIQSKMTPIFRQRQPGISYKNGWRLRCLPYIYLLGVHKAGTTDFYASLESHPQVRGMLPKRVEPQFWSRLPAEGIGLAEYLDTFDLVADHIRKNRDEKGHHPLVTLDASTHTYSSYFYWRSHPWVSANRTQCLTLAHHLKYISPKSKFILMIREPVSWVTSCYNFFYKKGEFTITNEMIERRVLANIARFAKCMKQTGDALFCAFDQVSASKSDMCNVVHTIYYIWVKLWMDVMGLDNFMVVRSEDYFLRRSETMEKVFSFLKLSPFEDIEKLDNRKVRNSNRVKKFQLTNYTVSAINNFLSPWNKKLIELTKDPFIDWYGNQFTKPTDK